MSAVKMYRVVATVSYGTAQGYRTSYQIPTFYLDPDIQGIRSDGHAADIARKIINPTGHLQVSVDAVLDIVDPRP